MFQSICQSQSVSLQLRINHPRCNYRVQMACTLQEMFCWWLFHSIDSFLSSMYSSSCPPHIFQCAFEKILIFCCISRFEIEFREEHWSGRLGGSRLPVARRTTSSCGTRSTIDCLDLSLVFLGYLIYALGLVVFLLTQCFQRNSCMT